MIYSHKLYTSRGDRVFNLYSLRAAITASLNYARLIKAQLRFGPQREPSWNYILREISLFRRIPLRVEGPGGLPRPRRARGPGMFAILRP